MPGHVRVGHCTELLVLFCVSYPLVGVFLDPHGPSGAHGYSPFGLLFDQSEGFPLVQDSDHSLIARAVTKSLDLNRPP